MKKDLQKLTIATLLLMGTGALVPISANAVVSQTWTDWVAAKDAGTEPNMPDFSYAGYHHGDDAIPAVAHTVYNVTQAPFNANPDDPVDDTTAIQAAIDAAEANGSGIVLLPKGRYIATGLTVNGNNIVVRGEGALAGGTEIFGLAQGQIISFKPTSTGNKATVSTVTANATRETFDITVANAATLSIGQMVSLYSRDPNGTLLADFFAPFTPVGTETLSLGVEVNERHVIAAINGNTITFEEPIHHDINASYNWEIRKAGNYLSEVGLEDIAIAGNFNNNNTFVHHRSVFDDDAWKGVELNHVHNSWVRRVRIINTNHGIDVKNAVNSSLLELILEGNGGHHGLLVNTSTRTMLGLIQERNIWEHPAGQTGPNAGNVFWRYDAREVMDLDNHGKYGYATLRDNISAHTPGNGSGSVSQSPRHLRHYTLWNYQYKFSGPASSQLAHNFWASKFSAIVQPTVVGYQTPGLSQNMLITTAQDHASTASPKPVYNTMAVNESYGAAVTPTSLYEAQLDYRLVNAPAWVANYQQDWDSFVNTNVTMDPALDNSTYASGSNVVLSATVPSELTDVAQVEFYNGTTLLGSDSIAPYSVSWSTPADGSHTVHARVVRTTGESGDSSAINLYLGTVPTTPLTTTIAQALTDVGSTATVLDTQPSSNLIDGDLGSYWTSNAAKRKPNSTRTEQLVDLDLGVLKDVQRVDIAWHEGDLRANYLRIHVSEDNVNWTEVLRTISSGTSTAMESYYIETSAVRYVRIIGFTNSVDRGTAISEIDVFGAEPASGSGTVTAYATEDGYTRSNWPDQNNGTKSYIRVRGGGSITSNTYLKFTVAGVTSPVTSAILRLHSQDIAINDTTAHAVSDINWAEATITYNNAPAIGTALQTVTNIQPATWVEFDVTSHISGDGTFSLGLSSTHNLAALDYDSSESALIPELVVSYGAEANNAPTFIADPFSKANATEAVAYTASIAADATDADSDPITFSKVTGAAWLSVAANGTLSGTPGAGDVGANAFTVQVTDGNGGSAASTLNITVDAAGGTPHTDTLVVVDGWDTKNGESLVDSGDLELFTASDDDQGDLETDGEYYSFTMSNISFPASATITSVKVYVEHKEEPGYSNGNMSLQVGTGWPGSQVSWASDNSWVKHTNDQLDVWDVSSAVNTTSEVNDLEFVFQNNDNSKKVIIDHVYVVVDWIE